MTRTLLGAPLTRANSRRLVHHKHMGSVPHTSAKRSLKMAAANAVMGHGVQRFLFVLAASIVAALIIGVGIGILIGQG